MAKDDYSVIIFKILAFLYRKLKKQTNILVENYILPLTSDFPIDEDYLNYVIEQLVNESYIDQVILTKAWGGDIVYLDISRARITPKGIEYLRDNSVMKKIAFAIEEGKSIISLYK